MPQLAKNITAPPRQMEEPTSFAAPSNRRVLEEPESSVIDSNDMHDRDFERRVSEIIIPVIKGGASGNVKLWSQVKTANGGGSGDGSWTKTTRRDSSTSPSSASASDITPASHAEDYPCQPVNWLRSTSPEQDRGSFGEDYSPVHVDPLQMSADSTFHEMRARLGSAGANLDNSALSGMLREAGGNIDLAVENFVSASATPVAPWDDEKQLYVPRRPLDEIVAVLGPRFDMTVLAPLLAKHRGRVPDAVSEYRHAPQSSGGPVRADRLGGGDQAAIDRHKVPEGGVPVMVNIYDISFKLDPNKPETCPESLQSHADQKADQSPSAKPVLNSGLPSIGLGVYHSGIEVYGREISFGWSDMGRTGVFEILPRCAASVMPKVTYKKTVVVGTAFVSRADVDVLLSKLVMEYPGSCYDVMDRNCNHFSNDLSKRLCKKKIPSYVNRPAKVGSAAIKASKVISSLSKLNPFAKSNKTPPKATASNSFNTRGSPKMAFEFSRARSSEEESAPESERRGRQRAPLAESFAESSRKHHHHYYPGQQQEEQEQAPIYSTMSKSNSHDALDTKSERIPAPAMMRMNKSDADLISMGDDHDDSSRCIETAIFTTPEESPRSSPPPAPSPSPAHYLTKSLSQDYYSSPTQQSASNAQNLQNNLNQTTPADQRWSSPGNLSSGARSFSSPFSRSSPMPPSPAPYAFRGGENVNRSTSGSPEAAQRSSSPQVVKGTTVMF